MPERPKYSEARERTIVYSLEKLAKRVTSFQRSLVEKIVDYFLDKFTTRDDKIVVNPSNFSAVNALQDIYDEWNQPKQKSILNLVIDSLTDLHGNNTDYFGEIADYDIKKDSEAVFTQMMKRLGYDRSKGRLTKGGYLQSIMDSDDPVIQLKVAALRAIVTGQSLADFKKSIDIVARGRDGSPGILEKHYGVHLYDVYQQYDREVGRLLAEKLGLKYAIYQGGLIKTSRPFCVHRNDLVFTTDEISLFGTPKDKYGGYSNKASGEFQGKPPVYNPFIDLGGYNCRHQLDYVSNELGAILRLQQDGKSDN